MADNGERLGQISIRNVVNNTKCECCKNYFNHEKMWHVLRWGINKNISSWYYCQNCMPTKNDVLNQIDTDDCEYGIFPVDNIIIRKKDKFLENKEEIVKNKVQSNTMHAKKNRLYKKKVLKK